MILRTIAMLALALSLGSVASPAAAGKPCWYNGKQYKEGARVGALVCKDGNWIKD